MKEGLLSLEYNKASRPSKKIPQKYKSKEIYKVIKKPLRLYI